MRKHGGCLAAAGLILLPLLALLALVMVVPTIQPKELAAGDAAAGGQICGVGKLSVPTKAKPWVAEAARTSGLPAGLIAAMMNQESGFQPAVFAADSNGGTWGLLQMNRSIWHGVYPQGDNPGGTPVGITDPMIHAQYGGIYLKQRLATVTTMQKAHPDAAYAKLPAMDALVIAHNAGEGNLQKYPNIPSITQGYLNNMHEWFTGAACPAGGTGVPGSSGQTGKDDYSAFMLSKGFTPGNPAYVVDIYSFYYGECTGYAAFAVAHYSKYKDFTNNWRNGSHFGNGKEWPAGARQAGIPVDTTPAVGSIASRITGRSGHVAYVTAVHPDGSFDVNEANFVKPHTFGSRTNLRVGSDFHYFLHFEK